MTQLQREVGLAGAVGLGLGSILGTGVFVSLSIGAGIAGPAVVVAVALAGLLATANGLSSAQLAAAHPVSGGTYEYGHEFVHPAAGFAAGWLFLLAKSASAATAALGCTGYALLAIGGSWPGWLRVGIAFGLTLGITGLVAAGIRRSNRLNAALVAVTLVSLGVFVGFGWATMDADRLGERFAFEWDMEPLLHATALMFVAYTGFGRVCTLGEEVRDPATTIPRAVVLTLGVSLVVYLAVVVTGVAVVGAPLFAEATGKLAAPLEVLARVFDEPRVAWIIGVGAVTAMAGVLLNLVLGLSRVLLAMARRGEMPRRFARVGDAGPTAAVWGMGLFVAALTLLDDVRLTWSFSAVTVLGYYGLTNLAALRLPSEARRFPRWIAWVGLVGCFGLGLFVEWPVWLAAAGLLAVGFLWRHLRPAANIG